MTTAEAIEKKEKEYGLAAELVKRFEALKLKQPKYFSNLQKIFAYVEELEKQLDLRREQEQRFLESLPDKVRARVEKDKAVLTLRKEILEMLKSSE